MQEWTSINAQPDQANVFAVVEFFEKCKKGRKQTNNTRRETGQVQL
jgi:hypothetical protein